MAIIGGGNARVQLATTGYRIAVGEDVSAEFDFGEPAEFQASNGKLYIALVDVEGGGEAEGDVEADDVESCYSSWLYEATSIEGEPEDIGDFDSEEEEEEDGEEEGGEGDEPEEGDVTHA